MTTASRPGSLGRVSGQGYLRVAFGADDLDITGVGAGPKIVGDATTALIAQLNRFAGPGVPAKYRVITAPYPLATGRVSVPVATTAILLFQRRLLEAVAQTPDPGTVAALADVNRGMADPVSYVMGNLPVVTRTIALFGDMAGLPPAAVGITGTAFGVPTRTLMLAGVVVLGVVLLAKRKGRR